MKVILLPIKRVYNLDQMKGMEYFEELCSAVRDQMVSKILNASNTSTHNTTVEDVVVKLFNIKEVKDINEKGRNQSYTELLEVLHMDKETS